MIKHTAVIKSTSTLPYQNIALEEYLLHNVAEGECILYLWQNRQTVVIGRNQNCWKECKIEELENDGGHLVRRLSGGGAVFHDMGNLNFTFLVRQEDYDVDRQLEVILKALQKLGINAQKSGRNDITVDGKKFSGNAFYSTNGHCYHHGTLLINVDMKNLTHYLNVDSQKLQSKGVSSVRARVANLVEFNPEITIELVCQKLTEAFGEVYQCTPTKPTEADIYSEKLKPLIDKFSSWEWNFGKAIPFTFEVSKRFEWGDIDLRLNINEGKVVEATAFSDAMNSQFITELSTVLVGCEFIGASLADRIDRIKTDEETDKTMAKDIKTLLSQQNSGR